MRYKIMSKDITKVVTPDGTVKGFKEIRDLELTILELDNANFSVGQYIRREGYPDMLIEKIVNDIDNSTVYIYTNLVEMMDTDYTGETEVTKKINDANYVYHVYMNVSEA